MPLELVADLRPRNPRAGRVLTWRGLSKRQLPSFRIFWFFYAALMFQTGHRHFAIRSNDHSWHRIRATRSSCASAIRRDCYRAEALPNCAFWPKRKPRAQREAPRS